MLCFVCRAKKANALFSLFRILEKEHWACKGPPAITNYSPVCMKHPKAALWMSFLSWFINILHMPEGCAWNIAGGVARWKIHLSSQLVIFSSTYQKWQLVLCSERNFHLRMVFLAGSTQTSLIFSFCLYLDAVSLSAGEVGVEWQWVEKTE